MTSLNEKIKFISFYQPSLPDGDYVLNVKQQVQIDQEYGWGQDLWTKAPGAQLKFSVAGPRFKIDPGLIQAQFPPPKSMGEYYNVLSQIIFKRTTLPWERTIDNAAPAATDSPKPWMALLLFNANDPVPKPTTLTLDKLTKTYKESAKPGNHPEFVKILPKDSPDPKNGELRLEAGQQANDRLTVIDVPKQLLGQLLPSEEEIEYLAHIKEGISATDASKKAEYPLILGSRLPAPGTSVTETESKVGSQSVVHLVSLESRKPLLDELSSNPSDNNPVRLVSLAKWSFSTLQRSKTFSGWLKQAWCPDGKRTDADDAGRSPSCTADAIHTLRMPTSSNADAEGFLSQGYVPLQHQTRQGNHLVSWYRGPLLPGKKKSTGSDSPVPFPVRSSDKLMRYFSDVDMFDATYAAAWELGRMLTLRSKQVSVSLFNWKRRHAQQLQSEAAQKSSHLPFAPDSGIMPDFPELVKEWLNELLILKHIPFHYLVPAEQMLPANSLRFFTVDDYWLESIVDGAFSVGRVNSADADRDRSIRNAPGPIPAAPGYSGFLLRSPVVAGWPHLGVEAYTQAIPSDQETNASKTKCLRMDRLGKDILLCLFEGDIQTIDIHEHPEAVHFGVDVGGDPNELDKYSKKLRMTDDKFVTVSDHLWKEPSKRIINIAKLKECAGASNAAEFGFAMTEGVENVRFIKKKNGPVQY